MASTEDLKPASAGNVKAAIGDYDTNLKTELGGGYIRDCLGTNSNSSGSGSITFLGDSGRYDAYELVAVAAVGGAMIEDRLTITATELSQCSEYGTNKKGEHVTFLVSYSNKYLDRNVAASSVELTGSPNTKAVTAVYGIK